MTEVAAPVPGKRTGRGVLSSIDRLPEAADEHIAWANAALRDRAMPQTEILREFNARLADLGIRGVSKGAFSRWSVRVAIETRKLQETRAITDAVLARMPVGERSDATLAAIELVKFRLLEMVMDSGDGENPPDPKLLGHVSLALQRLSSTALREAEGQRRARKETRAEAERREAAQQAQAEQAADQVERIVGEAGLGPDAIAALRKGVLGLTH